MRSENQDNIMWCDAAWGGLFWLGLVVVLASVGGAMPTTPRKGCSKLQ